ncbi:MAG: putative manganese-dependent inorganic diphosphatase, partial [Syntrophomonadaceae bacterium]|nr:putative manganese-dependent inorganic diphosphatase [Syntrophomonadaceae bacterium]
MLKPIYVIGHRNPDLDSVASAVGYAGLKNHLQGELHVAAVAGELNPESRFALERFGLVPPAPVTDVRARVEDLLEDEPGASVGPEERLSTFSALFRDRGVKTLAVVDDRRRLLGLMTLGDVALLYLEALGGPEADADAAPAALRRILGLTARQVMKTEGLVVLEASETVEEARKHMLASRFRNYPVVDDDNRFLGMVGRYHLLQMKRKRVVLVDHNERMQAVEGIEEAEILEIIDHHRLGDLQTSAPIYVRSEPLGATSTLVTEMYAERGVPVPPPVAGLLVSGILSDTMLFRSPTTTERDRRAAGVLAAAAGLDLEQWGRELLRHSARPQPASAEELIQADLKEYQ